MALPNPYNQYRQQQINTSSPDKLLLMLYDGAIRFCNMAMIAAENKQMEEAHNNLVKVQNIIQEFMATLNMDYDIAHSLYNLYEYLYRRLVEANMKKDPEIIAEVAGFLSELRETYAKAALLARGGQPKIQMGGVALEG